MDDDIYKRFVTLLPPSPFIHTSVSVAGMYLVLTTLSAIASVKSSYLFPDLAPYWRATLADITFLNSAICAVWFLLLMTIAAYRLFCYRRSAPSVSVAAYVLVYPLLAAGIFAILVGITSASSASGYGDHLGLLALALPLLIGMEFLGLQKWIKGLDPQFISNYMRPGWSVLLGRRKGASAEEHVLEVVGFQSRFNENASDLQKRPLLHLYGRAHSFRVFQGTLSSPVQTAPFVASEIRSATEALPSWTMTDVGCGDGSFTVELLSRLENKPTRIVCIDPERETLSEYDRIVSSRFPSITIRRYEDSVERIYRTLEYSDVILASHSLYYLLDNEADIAATVIRSLLERCTTFVGVLASRDSDAYKVKRGVIGHLALTDRSSFGGDLVSLLPTDTKRLSRDSIMEISHVIEDDDLLLEWCSYFCRIDRSVLEPHISFIRTLLETASIAWDSLPACVLADIPHVACAKYKRRVVPSCRVLLHKEEVFIASNQTSGGGRA